MRIKMKFRDFVSTWRFNHKQTRQSRFVGFGEIVLLDRNESVITIKTALIQYQEKRRYWGKFKFKLRTDIPISKKYEEKYMKYIDSSMSGRKPSKSILASAAELFIKSNNQL